MAAKAIVLIQTDIGAETRVMDELFKIPEIIDVYIVYGIYDIVAVIEAESLEKIREIITNKIRRLPEIRTTSTMVVVEGKSKRGS
ncbi:Lrp/AsnC ligand binding domain-containing protein [Desulfurococcaceae archaeon MEX13E-LK6-19]|nr:Lrp/AsnC ligand binding domain-containing protein [Desulfurococcaceae archaeon MEX13E-LK6-19]